MSRTITIDVDDLRAVLAKADGMSNNARTLGEAVSRVVLPGDIVTAILGGDDEAIEYSKLVDALRFWHAELRP